MPTGRFARRLALLSGGTLLGQLLLVLVSPLLTRLYAAAAVLVVWLIGDAFTRWIDTPALAPMLWLLPPTLLAVAIGTILEHWSMRRGTYRINGAGRTAQFGSQALLQVAFGLAGLKA